MYQEREKIPYETLVAHDVAIVCFQPGHRVFIFRRPENAPLPYEGQTRREYAQLYIHGSTSWVGLGASQYREIRWMGGCTLVRSPDYFYSEPHEPGAPRFFAAEGSFEIEVAAPTPDGNVEALVETVTMQESIGIRRKSTNP